MHGVLNASSTYDECMFTNDIMLNLTKNEQHLLNTCHVVNFEFTGGHCDVVNFVLTGTR